MAVNTRQTLGLTKRELQLGLNKRIEDAKERIYVGPYEDLFPIIKHDKIIYEIEKLAGMGPAGKRNEGAVIENYDTINQFWLYAPRIITYEKSARITLEAQHYNLYQKILPKLGDELVKAHKYQRDIQCSNVLNNAFTGSVTYGDGVALCASNHPIFFGGTQSNIVTADFDEDAIEQMKILIDQLANDDGQVGNYEPDTLWYPIQLRFEVERLQQTPYRVSTANNDVNLHEGLKTKMWKRLSSSKAFFMTTTSAKETGFCLAETMPIQMKDFADNFTWDSLVSAVSMWAPIVMDGSRAIVGSAGI